MPNNSNDNQDIKKLRSIIMEFQRAREAKFNQEPSFKARIYNEMTNDESIRINTLNGVYQKYADDINLNGTNILEASLKQNLTLLQLEDIKIGIMMRVTNISEITEMIPTRAHNLETANKFNRYHAQNISFACLG
jgi:hypothetical protein